MGVFETQNLLRPYSDAWQNLDLFTRKETRNHYWSRILSDKMNDSHDDYFFSSEKRRIQGNNSLFSFSSSCFASFFDQIINQRQFLGGTPKWESTKQKIFSLLIRTRGRIQICLLVRRRGISTGTGCSRIKWMIITEITFFRARKEEFTETIPSSSPSLLRIFFGQITKQRQFLAGAHKRKSTKPKISSAPKDAE